MARKGKRKRLPKFPRQRLLKDGKTFKNVSATRTSRGLLITQMSKKRKR